MEYGEAELQSLSQLERQLKILNYTSNSCTNKVFYCVRLTNLILFLYVTLNKKLTEYFIFILVHYDPNNCLKPTKKNVSPI